VIEILARDPGAPRGPLSAVTFVIRIYGRNVPLLLPKGHFRSLYQAFPVKTKPALPMGPLLAGVKPVLIAGVPKTKNFRCW